MTDFQSYPGSAVAWQFHDGSTVPDVKKGNYDDFVILIENDKGKRFVYAAYYLNAFPLERDECECKEEHDEGCPATGWFEDNSNFEYDHCYFPVSAKIVAWARLPTAEEATASLSGVAQAEHEPSLETTRALHDFASDYRKQEEIIEELGDRIGARDAQLFDLERQLRSAQASANCDCGFSAEVCKTNPCMRKKMATSGLNPEAKYPYCGAERVAQEKAIAWMNSAHVEAYQAGQKDGIAWASPVQSDFYTVALYVGPSVSSTLRQCPICARRVASPCETLAIATSCPLSSTHSQTAKD